MDWHEGDEPITVVADKTGPCDSSWERETDKCNTALHTMQPLATRMRSNVTIEWTSQSQVGMNSYNVLIGRFRQQKVAIAWPKKSVMVQFARAMGCGDLDRRYDSGYWEYWNSVKFGADNAYWLLTFDEITEKCTIVTGILPDGPAPCDHLATVDEPGTAPTPVILVPPRVDDTALEEPPSAEAELAISISMLRREGIASCLNVDVADADSSVVTPVTCPTHTTPLDWLSTGSRQEAVASLSKLISSLEDILPADSLEQIDEEDDIAFGVTGGSGGSGGSSGGGSGGDDGDGLGDKPYQYGAGLAGIHSVSITTTSALPKLITNSDESHADMPAGTQFSARYDASNNLAFPTEENGAKRAKSSGSLGWFRADDCAATDANEAKFANDGKFGQPWMRCKEFPFLEFDLGSDVLVSKIKFGWNRLDFGDKLHDFGRFTISLAGVDGGFVVDSKALGFNSLVRASDTVIVRFALPVRVRHIELKFAALVAIDEVEVVGGDSFKN
jgi:hypothetical protein